MTVDDERKSLLEKIVALHGGKASARRRYERFSTEALRQCLPVEEEAAERIRRHGRLEAVWMEDGGEIVPPGELEMDDAAAADEKGE